jgi:cytochrome P450
MTQPVLLDAAFAMNPYPVYRSLRDGFPVLQHPQLGYVLSRHQDVAAAAVSSQLSTECYGPSLEPLHGGPTLMQMDGREHAWRRQLIGRGINGAALKTRYVAVVEELCESMLDAIRPGMEFDFVEAVSRHLPIAVVVRVLGLPLEDVPSFQRWYSALVASFANFAADPAVHRAGEVARDELGAYLVPQIERRRACPEGDLLSELCQAADGGVEKLSTADIRAFASLMLLAGGETTDKALASLLANLLQNSEQLASLRQDLTLVDAAITESLRYSSPVQLNMRLVKEAVVVEGVSLPVGSAVTLLLGSANRDERKFDRPEVFDILRSDSNVPNGFTAAADHLAFGRGRHFCIGAPLARIELTTALTQMMQRFGTWQLTRPAVDEGVFTRGPSQLWMKVA